MGEYQNSRNYVSEKFHYVHVHHPKLESFNSTSASQNCFEGSMAGSTRRFSPAWYQYGETVADEEKTELEIDFRIQGIPQAAVEQEDERTRGIERLVHLIKNHSNQSASFSTESKKVIHNLENVLQCQQRGFGDRNVSRCTSVQVGTAVACLSQDS